MINDAADQKLFREVVANFQQTYPHRNIELEVMAYGLIVKVDGEDKFNATGYNLLYNLQRLCKALESELR